MTDFPKSMVIVGAGVIGCEYATMFSNFGKTKIYLIDRADKILPFEDQDISNLIENYDFNEFIENPGNLYKEINDHHQLRWLADGVNRMALGCIMNSMWDCWAKLENKPLWKLLVDLSPEKVINSIDWRYLKDALTPEEAIAILNEKITLLPNNICISGKCSRRLPNHQASR